MRKVFLFVVTFAFLSVFFSSQKVSAQCASEPVHELTIYVMPTLHPIDWSSPAKLYKTMRECYVKTITVKDNYLLGHIAVGFDSPLRERKLLSAMTCADRKVRNELVLKHKVGFAIMGAPLPGRIETEEELNHKLTVYAKRNKLAFITYRLNDKAALRITEFLKQYTQKMNSKNAPSDFYGGAFWPRYRNEGAGCSAFGMALLSVANVLTSESDDWIMKVNIPMSIIGGEFNNNKKIKNSTILRTKSWHDGSGLANVDYVTNKVYEPSLMFDWILDERNNSKSKMQSVERDGVPGLYVDCRDVPVKEDEPLFVERKDTDVFIERFKLKLGTDKDNTAN